MAEEKETQQSSQADAGENKEKESQEAAKEKEKEKEKNEHKGKKSKKGGGPRNKFVRAVAKALKAVGQAIVKVFIWIVSAIASIGWPVFLILGIVIIIVIIVAAVVSYTSSKFNGDYQNGLYSPGFGVKGDAFYGERYLYYDSEFSSNEMSDIYKEFTYNILKDVNDNYYHVNISFAADANNNDSIYNITYDYAMALSGSSHQDYSLNYHTNMIDHYGFTLAESETVISKMSNYLVTNNMVSGVTQEQLALKIKEKFDSDYSYMKNVCSKIVIKDYLFEDAESGLKELPKKNYFGMVFMPNKEVTIKETAFTLILDNTRTANVAVKIKNAAQPPETIEEAEADETWFVDGEIKTTLDVNLEEYQVAQFGAIDTNNINYLAEGKSLFTMLREDKFETYFNNTLGDYSEQALLENIKTNNYLYLDIDADSYFVVADIYSEYE